MTQTLLWVVLGLCLVFAWTNGARDASNAVAPSLATRALNPGPALALAAVLNVVGALLGQGVFTRIFAAGYLDPSALRPAAALLALTGALVAAVAWNALTWRAGLPSSSTHALAGGVVGAGLVAGAGVAVAPVLLLVLVPLVLSPLLGLALSVGVVRLLQRLFAEAAYGRAGARLRVAQSVSTAAMALGHGLQDGPRTIGVMLTAQVLAGPASRLPGQAPWDLRVAAALALGLGTAQGGWRLIRTIGRRLVPMEPVTGFGGQAVAAGLLYLTATAVRLPVSSTHTVVGSVIGAGVAARGPKAPRWRVIRQVVGVWLLTFPATGALAAAVTYLLLLPA